MPVNIEDYLGALDNFLKNPRQNIRIGTGEFTDSLALDSLTGYSRLLIDFFSHKDSAILELKTKSNNVDSILDLKHNRKTVVSWSLNPQALVDSDDWKTSALKERLTAAKKCCQAGYSVSFHFDPIIYSRNWEVLYKELVDRLFREVKPENIAWISLGTFRFPPYLKTIIEQRFPESKILDEELVLGFDRKLRYSSRQRIFIYKKMYSWIRKHSQDLLVYLCMEPKEIWQEVLARNKF
jgi:spore photoproduct lyase